MKSGVFLPLFGELAEPAVVARLDRGCRGGRLGRVFVWDHIQYRPPVTDVADPWVTLAAMACATER